MIIGLAGCASGVSGADLVYPQVLKPAIHESHIEFELEFQELVFLGGGGELGGVFVEVL